MDIGSIFLILAILVLVVVYIAQPLLQRNAASVSDEEQEYSALLAERDRILNILQELDFDHTLGKIPRMSIHPKELHFSSVGQLYSEKLMSTKDSQP